jgi:hypothetical protein
MINKINQNTQHPLHTDPIQDQGAVGAEMEPQTSVKASLRRASVEQVARFLGAKPEDVQQWIDGGELPATQDDQGTWISEESLANFIVSRALKATKEPGIRPECRGCPMRNKCKAAAAPQKETCQCPVCWCRLEELRDKQPLPVTQIQETAV